MKERQFGNVNPYEVGQDEERNKKQKELLMQRGPSNELIIMILSDGKYELLEGWHRTMQALQLYPQGYTQQAWIGILKNEKLDL